MTTLLIIVSSLLIISYTTAVCIKGRKIPNSISASFYAIKHKYWFRTTMWGTPMLLFPAALEVGRDASGWLFFLAVVGMIAVGCAPDYQNDRFQKSVHEAGAIMAVGFSQAWVYCNKPEWLWLWAAYAVYTVVYAANVKEDSIRRRFMRTKPMFWIEVSAISIMVMTLLFFS